MDHHNLCFPFIQNKVLKYLCNDGRALRNVKRDHCYFDISKFPSGNKLEKTAFNKYCYLK